MAIGDPGDRDQMRIDDSVRSRLFALGVPALPTDSTEELIQIVESIERFENVVRARGGDLMVDEPPHGSRPQPDAPGLSLPQRAEGEPASLYIERVDRAAELAAVELRRRP